MARATIVITGAAILCLQLIASRVMTPFFGVSLLIWTGILSVTLLCLALGYYYGGVFCRCRATEAIRSAYYLSPALSGLWLVAAVLLYPVCLGPLASFSLVGGAFLASLLILAVPLILLSALNPLLVALERPLHGEADAGAGWVFFISTMGSVAGVLVAAFALIPYLSGRHSILVIAAALCLLAALGARRGRVLVLALAGLAAALALGLIDPAGRAGRLTRDGAERPWSIIATYPSAFGVLKVVEVGQGDNLWRVLFNDGLAQNGFDAKGRPALQFTHFLEAGAAHLVPMPRKVLVLGLGAGVIPAAFEARGARVEVVEINHRAFEAARDHFGYTPGPATTLIFADARTEMRACSADHDMVFVDLFSGDGMPEHLLTREFFTDVRRCLNEGGVVAINSFLDTGHTEPFRAALASLVDVFGKVAFVEQAHPASRSITNAFLFTARQPGHLDRLAMMRVEEGRVSAEMAAQMSQSLRSLQWIDAASPLVAGVRVLTDEANPLAALAAPSQMTFRRRAVATIPDPILVD
ncbi:Spermidine synthase-like protein [Paramagnetospirillum magnetotacticum MS-1]|uniref:Spermidine synthase-like protein n=1 Tax=Paramagnetospirillum magnetotacticum MS-1 TaxID=272627 RepID=A0A0C2YF09_PARME|nr:fused MFS/spermidine synthase [Paramagnetospirillum magnetotacticum]KIL98304.1 Spermidine synthase-like protein [Paramagnetospirillum magnetotacticum MS-1]